jgi:TPR repeat protein
VRRDYTQALIWLREAASQGGAVGQSFLGALYADGRGVPQDYVQAHMWFNLAASGASAGELHDGAVIARDTMAAKMTPDQIAEAQKMAREWVPKK